MFDDKNSNSTTDDILTMGIGDEIMAVGQAFTQHCLSGKRVQILGADNRPRWDELWENLPWLAKPDEVGDFDAVVNFGGNRPYISYPFTREIGCTYSGWRARDNVAEFRFFDHEKSFAKEAAALLGPFVLVEPNLTPRTNPNKQWGREKWQSLVSILCDRGVTIAQMGAEPLNLLDGARFIQTSTFRLAAALLQKADSAVLPEGGLHHAAGALRKRVVVLFGGAVDVSATGYDDHINIVQEPACGRWLSCDHCHEIWSRLDPAFVADVLISSIQSENAPGSILIS